MIKDDIYQILLEKISLSSFNIFIFIYFKILKLVVKQSERRRGK